jgi:uncharacterized membrane protein YidH (DUF202 family)
VRAEGGAVTLTRASTRRRHGLLRRLIGWLLVLVGVALVLAGAGVVFSGPHPGEEWYLRDVSGWAGIALGLVILSLGIFAAGPAREPGWWS